MPHSSNHRERGNTEITRGHGKSRTGMSVMRSGRRESSDGGSRMKQWAPGVAAVVALVLVMAVSGVTAPQTTLEFWTISLQPFFTDYVNGLVAGYRRANPGVQVKWVDVQFQAVEQKLLAAIAGGIPPDVVNLNVEFTSRIAERGALVDMDAAVPAADPAKYF